MFQQPEEKVVLAIPVQVKGSEKSKQLSNLLKRFTKGDKQAPRLSEYMDKELVTFLEVADRDTALTSLVDLLSENNKLKDRNTFFKALMQRESIVSTGIGMGVAIPHAKLDEFDDFFIAISIQKSQEGIEWDALDGSPVYIIFMIGGPPDRQTEYLQILSRLTMAIKDETCRDQLRTSQTPEAALDFFKNC